jgi:molybdate/tungstate transport system ATP-binding protein
VIELRELSLHAGSFHVRDVSLHVGADEYFVLLGPTGSGKTLLVSCLCGLLPADWGTVHIGGEDLTLADPRRRHIGYVPQQGVLFPHMSVLENILFAPRARGASRSAAMREVRPLVQSLGLEPLLGRSPEGLSGGERQKVALVRALAGRPRVLVLDEPVSALDERTRRDICAELLRVQRELGVATIHICHNREEALQVGDRAGIMYDGRLVQTGHMEELLHRPANEEVARLLGAENIFSGQAEPGETQSTIDFGWGRIQVPGRHSGEVTFMVRPESLALCAEDHPNAVPAVLESARYMGTYSRLEFDNGAVVFVHPSNSADLPMGRRCSIHFPPDSVHVL